MLCVSLQDSFGVEANSRHLGTSEMRLLRLWERLGSLKSGQALVARAREYWKVESDAELFVHLKMGTSSRTDTVLTRHFSKQTGQERLERQTVIFLKESQPDVELLFDLSHELIHATSGPAFDPYDPSLNLSKYITQVIGGPGGEVDAVMAECAVAQDWLDAQGGSISRCSHYISPREIRQKKPALSRNQILEDFYRVGSWLHQITEALGEESRFLPLLKEDSPRLFSSLTHAPYPAALLGEYRQMTETVCKNTLERKLSLSRQLARNEGGSGVDDRPQTGLKSDSEGNLPASHKLGVLDEILVHRCRSL